VTSVDSYTVYVFVSITFKQFRSVKMSDIENEQKAREDVTHDLMFIAEKVRAHPENLEKSQVPAMKKKKTTVLTKIVQQYVTLFGKEIEINNFISLKCQTFLVSFSTLEKCCKQLNFHKLLQI
jgi:hypothetical protein